jgi:putative addiction module killer protein
MKVMEYLQEDGSSPYKIWFDSLDAQAAAKVVAAKARLEIGLLSSIKWLDVIGEYRIDWGPGYRIYLAKDGADLIVLFGGGTKKRQNADIKQARILFEEYKVRKAKLKAEQEKQRALEKKKEGRK